MAESLFDGPATLGPEPAAPADPNHSYYDTEAGGGGQTITTPQDVVVEEPEATATEADTFDRKYVEGLRDEAARYRTRARDYEQTFGEMDPALREGWLELIRMANSDDPNAQQVLAEMLGFEIAEEPQEPVVPTDVPQYLTREEAAEIARQEAWNIAQMEQAQRAEQEAIRGVVTEAEKLGYSENSMEYIQLLYLADQIDMGTLADGQTLLQAADAQLKSMQQQQWQDYEQRKVAEAGGTPVAPSGNGASPSIARTPKTWEEARDMLHERLANS